MSAVRVVLPIGEDTYPCCVADVFTSDELTITALRDGSVMRTYGPLVWIEARVYASDGYALYAHRNPRAAEAQQAATERVKALRTGRAA